MKSKPAQIHAAKNASNHVLARVRREMGVMLKHSKDDLGLAPDTVKGIMSGRSELKLKSARIVSLNTGISVSCLLENNPGRPLVAVNGRRFTKKFYENFKTSELRREIQSGQYNEQYAGTRILHYQRILSLKVACAMIAAYQIGESDLAYFKISRALEQIEDDFINPRADKVEARQFLRNWYRDAQLEIGKIKPSTRNMPKRWAVIWQKFFTQTNAIYKTRVTASAKPAKPAKPTRR